MKLEVVEYHAPIVEAKVVSGFVPTPHKLEKRAWQFLDYELELANVQKPTILKNGKTKIVFNPPYTIFENDGVVGKAKCSPDDEYDPIVGLELAMFRCVKSHKEELKSMNGQPYISDFVGGDSFDNLMKTIFPWIE